MKISRIDSEYKGTHNGTVSGKGFEKSRRARKSHYARKMERANRDRMANKN